LKHWTSLLVVAAGLLVATTVTRAFDETKYPDWEGAWRRPAGVQWDPSKPAGPRQQARQEGLTRARPEVFQTAAEIGLIEATGHVVNVDEGLDHPVT
jgi:hypothetical protein